MRIDAIQTIMQDERAEESSLAITCDSEGRFHAVLSQDGFVLLRLMEKSLRALLDEVGKACADILEE